MSEVQGDNPNFFFQRCTFSWVLENPTLAFTSIKHVQNPIFLGFGFQNLQGFFSTSTSQTSVTNAGAGGRSLHFLVMDEARGGKNDEARSERWWAGEGYRSYTHIMSIIVYCIHDKLTIWAIYMSLLHHDWFPHCIKMDFWYRSCAVTKTPKKSRTAGNSTEKVKTLSIRPTLSLMPLELQREWSVLQDSSFVHNFKMCSMLAGVSVFCSAWHRISLKIVPIPP